MKKVLILGGNGYIGTRLRQVLREHHFVKTNDICWFNHDETSDRRDYAKYTREELAEFEVIVVLAGHSSVPSCNGALYSPWLNNVTNFTNLLDKLDISQLVIYASSASVYGNSAPGERHKETNKIFVPVNNYDVTKYALDQQATIANLVGRRVIGLRFGTVNGYSANLRVDVMINSMFHSVQNGTGIQVSNKHISRAMLGIEDLCRAVERCIEQPMPGIYNLSSFNATVGEIAEAVSRKLGAEIVDKGNTANAYDFALDTALFEQTFDFEFTETTNTILNSLLEHYGEALPQWRDKYIIYNWEIENAYGRR
jgi:nucleoside-diphosphate-sugar epimerase